ncbi:MAG TPA: hypothetical protein H9884_09455 [Candidatus Yaniella excrementigallinarum]|nr:hypothetical protein [Candidatus Yaniella excrementigallinarum]
MKNSEPEEFETFETGTYLHGTKAELQPEDLLVPGYKSNFVKELHDLANLTRLTDSWRSKL